MAQAFVSPAKKLTPGEYLEIERQAGFRSQHWDGHQPEMKLGTARRRGYAYPDLVIACGQRINEPLAGIDFRIQSSGEDSKETG